MAKDIFNVLFFATGFAVAAFAASECENPLGATAAFFGVMLGFMAIFMFPGWMNDNDI